MRRETGGENEGGRNLDEKRGQRMGKIQYDQPVLSPEVFLRYAKGDIRRSYPGFWLRPNLNLIPN